MLSTLERPTLPGGVWTEDVGTSGAAETSMLEGRVPRRLEVGHTLSVVWSESMMSVGGVQVGYRLMVVASTNHI